MSTFTIPPVPPVPDIPPIPGTDSLNELASLAVLQPHDHVSDFSAMVIVVATLLICVALPVFLHYRSKARALQAAAPADQPAMRELWATARRMEERIGYLEAVLDTEVPGWRRGGVR